MERFSRTEKLLGQEKMERLKSSTVLIAGLGAVGSFTAEALARSGIGSLILIDFDIITQSNINRQVFALESTLGQLKTEAAVNRLHDINPDCKLFKKNLFIDTDTLPKIFLEKPDIVIDAIDSVGPKIELLAYCLENKIPVISSMGAARRIDPSAVTLGDIFQTENCPLARIMRKALRRRGFYTGLPCVYSKELPDRTSKIELDTSISSSKERTKILGSLPTVTGVFGLLLADATIKFLLK